MTQAQSPAAIPLPEKLWVRIYPYNPAQGHKKKTFLVAGFPTAFTVEAGWYELDARLAVQLKKFRNNPNDEGSKPVFQVTTQEKAMEFDVRAQRKAAEATAPHRVAANPLQSRFEIPKPINLNFMSAPLPVAPVKSFAVAPQQPAAPSFEPSNLENELADALAEIVEEEAIETADPDEQVFETEVGRGDLTTSDLAPAKPAPTPAPTPVVAPEQPKVAPTPPGLRARARSRQTPPAKG